VDEAHQALAARGVRWTLPVLFPILLGTILTNACDTGPTSPTAAQGKDAAGTEDVGSPMDDPADARMDALPRDRLPTAPGLFANRVVDFIPGGFAGFGQDKLPGVVLGPPQGAGASAGSLDVLSLGKGGCIVLSATNTEIIDEDGPDLLVFENPFSGFFETGVVSVSGDGNTWATFPCAATDKAANYPGCAGTHYVYASPENGIDPTDPTTAGGDPYDLRDLGLASARYVRICDSGQNGYAGTSGGFDLDAVAVVHGRRLVH
jgi:hypothetical protein